MRTFLLVIAVCAVFARVAATQTASPPAEPAANPSPPAATQAFDVWLAEFIHEANERGYNEALIRDTLIGLEPLPRVIQADRSQAELTPGLDRYLSTRITKTVISRGRAQAKQHRTLLSRIEDEYGVQRRFVL